MIDSKWGSPDTFTLQDEQQAQRGYRDKTSDPWDWEGLPW